MNRPSSLSSGRSEDVQIADCDLDVEVTVNDSPSVGSVYVPIVVRADCLIRGQFGTVAGPDVQDAGLR